MYAAVSLEILVRFTYFTVKRRAQGGGEGEVREDRCLRKGRDAGVDGGGITEGGLGVCNGGRGWKSSGVA